MIIKPVRIQLSRRKGFNLQAWSRAVNGLPAVHVARPWKFGNPFQVEYAPAVPLDGWRAVDRFSREQPGGYSKAVFSKAEATARVVEAFRFWFEGALTPDPDGASCEQALDTLRAGLLTLRGKNLACWCALGAPCHADVLLELANAAAEAAP